MPWAKGHYQDLSKLLPLGWLWVRPAIAGAVTAVGRLASQRALWGREFDWVNGCKLGELRGETNSTVVQQKWGVVFE
jgi:hypothetical protein